MTASLSVTPVLPHEAVITFTIHRPSGWPTASQKWAATRMRPSTMPGTPTTG